MKNALLGAIAGLALGSVGALAYSHYVGDGALVADLQAQLDAANAALAEAKKDKQQITQLSSENTGVSAQIDALSASNADLRKQIETMKASPPAALNPVTLAGMMMGMMRGGGGPFQSQQRLFVMQARLKLTPDQSAAIKAAMDADNKARRDLMRQRFQNGGKVDPAAAAAADTLDKTLATVLTPSQQVAYEQLQADEKAARAETSATAQVDNMMPLLQLNDSQKSQAMDALYQVQMAAADPTSLVTAPDPMGAIATQAQSTESVLAKVLTPDQLALYQREAQVTADAMASFRGGRGGNNGGGGNGAVGGTSNPAGAGTAVASPSATPISGSVASPAASPAATAATSTDSSATTTSAPPSATTNAAPTQ